MRIILSIAILNFKSAIKEKIFIGIVFLFLFLLAVSSLLATMGVGESVKIIRNAGLVGIELTGLLLIVFSLIFNFYREKDSRMQEVYLSFLSRSGFLGGKLLGYIFLLFFYCLIAAAGYGLILFFNDALSLRVIVGIYPIFLKLCIILFFTLLFSVIFTSNFVALFSSFFVYLSSELIGPALELVKSGGPLQIIILKGVYHMLPNFDKLDIKTQAVYEQLPSISFFLYITFYTVIYLIFMYLLTCLIFGRKEC